jgi:hypothetical protein
VFGTQLIGDATNWPTIKAAPSFVGMGVLATDEYVPNGGNGADGNAKEWYINTVRATTTPRMIDYDYHVLTTSRQAFTARSETSRLISEPPRRTHIFALSITRWLRLPVCSTSSSFRQARRKTPPQLSREFVCSSTSNFASHS